MGKHSLEPWKARGVHWHAYHDHPYRGQPRDRQRRLRELDHEILSTPRETAEWINRAEHAACAVSRRRFTLAGHYWIAPDLSRAELFTTDLAELTYGRSCYATMVDHYGTESGFYAEAISPDQRCPCQPTPSPYSPSPWPRTTTENAGIHHNSQETIH